MSTGVGKIVEPYLQSPCIAGNRKLQRLWDQRGYDAAGADAIEQTAPQDFAAGMEPGESFDVPDLSAAPISTTARQTLWSKLDRDPVAARDFTFIRLLPVR